MSWASPLFSGNGQTPVPCAVGSCGTTRLIAHCSQSPPCSLNPGVRPASGLVSPLNTGGSSEHQGLTLKLWEKRAGSNSSVRTWPSEQIAKSLLTWENLMDPILQTECLPLNLLHIIFPYGCLGVKAEPWSSRLREPLRGKSLRVLNLPSLLPEKSSAFRNQDLWREDEIPKWWKSTGVEHWWISSVSFTTCQGQRDLR